MKKIRLFTSLVLAIVVLSCCEGGDSQRRGLMSSTGRAGELLVVCTDKQWKGELGDSLQAILMQPVLILPQYEPIFSLYHVTPQRFKEAYQKQRNIVILSIDSTLEKGKMSISYNQWATPQSVIQISANNTRNLINELSNRQNNVINHLMNGEMKRFLKAQKSRQDFKLSREIEKTYKLSMVVPNGFVFAVKNSNFCWMRRDSKNWTQNIMIYTQDYDANGKQFSQKHILQLRDSLTKQHIIGPADSSYITTEKEYVLPILEQSSAFGDNHAVRTIGLWKTEGAAGVYMGGPFVSYTILDEKRNRVVTADAFLYAPADKKRDLLRQIEAVLLYVKVLE